MPKVSEGLRKLHQARVNRGIENPVLWDAGEVIPGKLWVGSLGSARNVDRLRENQITHVLTSASRLKVYKDVPDFITHLQLDIPDHPAASLFSILTAALEFLNEAFSDDSNRVLVHCASGVSRSVSVCCAHLILGLDMTLKDALAQIRENRRQAGPNAGFHFQLELLSKVQDLEEAEALYKEKISTATIMEQIIAQREVANEFHSKVDLLEDEIQSGIMEDAEVVQGWLESLEELSSRIDDITLDAEGVQDRPAKMIRKSAANKVSRLLQQIQGTDEVET